MNFKQLQNQKEDEVIELLNRREDNSPVVFKSPTGSGKTVMLSHIMNKLLTENDKYVFIVSSLSKGDLAMQNYEQFQKQKNLNCTKLNPYLIKSKKKDTSECGTKIPQNKNVYVLPRDLLGKDRRISKEQSLKILLEGLKAKSKVLVLIKDECHDATNNLDNYGNYFVKKLFVSATPDIRKGQIPSVELSEKDAIDNHLIKSVKYEEKETSLEKILDKYQGIKEDYLQELNLRPCLLIQISNKLNGEKEKEKILSVLRQDKYSNLHYISIFGDIDECETNDNIGKSKDLKLWKKYTKDDHSTIDVVIFKLSLAEGWDIKRACMLYQVRETQSEQLDEQVVGRVRRNPKLLEFDSLSDRQKEIISTAYVYGVPKKENRVIKVELTNPEEVKKEIQIRTTTISPEIKKVEIKDLLKEEDELTRLSIFKLRERISSIKDEEINSKINDYIDSYDKWFSVGYNAANIKNKLKELKNENLNPSIVKDEKGKDKIVSISQNSSFVSTEFSRDIEDWIWRRTDNNEEFSFDSQTEKEWFEILKKIIKESNKENKKIGKKYNDGDNYLIAKNYPTNSEIRFSYYLDGIKNSYPDFILKDNYDRLHFFESKSLNQSSSLQINNDDYKEKIKALKQGYKEASKIVPYHFYIPIKKEDTWTIWHYFNNKEDCLNTDSFKELLQNKD